MDLLRKLVLHREFGLSPREVDNMTVEEVDNFMFMIDVFNKRSALKVVN